MGVWKIQLVNGMQIKPDANFNALKKSFQTKVTKW